MLNENIQRFIIAIALVAMLGYMVFINKIGAEYFMGLITGVIGFYFTDSVNKTKDDDKGDNKKEVR